MEKLPLELKVYILNYLDSYSLNRCLEVSKEYYNLILNSSVLMRKLPFVLTADNSLSKIQTLKNNGSFMRSAIIRDHAYYLSDLLCLMPNLQQLHVNDQMYNYQLSSQLTRNIEKIVQDHQKNVENSKKAILAKISPTNDQSIAKITITLDHLDALTIESNNPFVVENIISRFYHCKTIRKLHFLTRSCELNFEMRNILTKKFLMQLRRLEELTMSILPYYDVIFENYYKMPFRLKKLTIGFDWMSNSRFKEINFENLYAFMRSQQGSLLTLNLAHCGPTDGKIERKKVRIIEWMFRENFKRFMKTNFKMIFDSENFPFNDEMCFRKLEKLRFWYFDDCNVKIPNQRNLLELDVIQHREMNSIEGWQVMGRKFEKLEKLFVRCFDDIDDEFFKFMNENFGNIFKQMKNLKSLKISTYGYVILKFKPNPPAVKILTLDYESCAARSNELKLFFPTANVEILTESCFENILEI